jgi:hypothetical protein
MIFWLDTRVLYHAPSINAPSHQGERRHETEALVGGGLNTYDLVSGLNPRSLLAGRHTHLRFYINQCRHVSDGYRFRRDSQADTPKPPNGQFHRYRFNRYFFVGRFAKLISAHQQVIVRKAGYTVCHNIDIQPSCAIVDL